MRRLLLWIACLILVAGGAMYAWLPQFRYASWVLLGHSPVCPLAQAMGSGAHEKAILNTKDRLLHASHLVSEDRGLELLGHSQRAVLDSQGQSLRPAVQSGRNGSSDLWLRLTLCSARRYRARLRGKRRRFHTRGPGGGRKVGGFDRGLPTCN